MGRIFPRHVRRWIWLTACAAILAGTLLLLVLWDADLPGQWPSVLPVPEQFSADLPGCSAVIRGYTESNTTNLAALLATRRKKQLLLEDFYLNATKNCQAYIKQRGFITVPLSEEEKHFPIAYSMVIHNQIEMFERLLRAVYAPQNVYCVHVDRKSPDAFQEAVRAIVACFPNVFVATKLESVVYASWSRVQADLNCMEDLLKSEVRWRYLLNTCGADFPLKTNREMVNIFTVLNGRNSMETKVTPEHKKARWQLHHEVTTSIKRTGVKKSPPPFNTAMFAGNAYFVASRAFVEHVMQDVQVREFMEWEKDTYSPDEHMWATLQRMNAVPGSAPIHTKYDVADMLSFARVVKWSYMTGDVVNKGAAYPPCTGAYRRAVCVYGAGDLQWLLAQKQVLANKFDPEVDDVAIRCLEAVLRFKALGYDPLT